MLSRPVKNRDEWQLMNLFFDQLPKELLSIQNYTVFLKQADQAGNFAKASEIFMKIKQRADTFTYNSFINAAGKNGKFEEAKAAFEMACDLKINDFITTHIYIDILVQMGFFNEARAICNRTQLPHPPITQDNKLDLHHYSHGTGFLAVSRFLANHPRLNSLGVVCGKGCKEDGNYLTFRADLVKLAQKHLKEWTVKLIEQNEGEIQLVRHSDPLQNII
jgi:pentatricopeptide repeat protein